MKKNSALAAAFTVFTGLVPVNAQVFEDLNDSSLPPVGLSGGEVVTSATEVKKTPVTQAEAKATAAVVNHHYHSTKRVVVSAGGGVSKADIGRLESKIDGLSCQFAAHAVAAQNALARKTETETAANRTHYQSPPPEENRDREGGWWWVLFPIAAAALAVGWWWGARGGGSGLKDPNRASCGSFDPQGVPQGWGKFKTNTTRDGSMLEATSEQVAIAEAEARAEAAHAAALERAARAAERRQERGVARRLLADPPPAEPAGGWQAGPGPAGPAATK